ncbi:mediator complex, subunit Med21, partial [Kipferlia bialata]
PVYTPVPPEYQPDVVTRLQDAATELIVAFCDGIETAGLAEGVDQFKPPEEGPEDETPEQAAERQAKLDAFNPTIQGLVVSDLENRAQVMADMYFVAKELIDKLPDCMSQEAREAEMERNREAYRELQEATAELEAEVALSTAHAQRLKGLKQGLFKAYIKDE